MEKYILEIKIISILFALTYIFLVVTNKIEVSDFKNVFTIIISFYFGQIANNKK